MKIRIRNKDVWNRITRGVRYAEGMQSEDGSVPYTHTSGVSGFCIIEVTHPSAVDGFYQGRIIYRDLSPSNPLAKWCGSDDDSDCFAQGLNEEPLIYGRRYIGNIAGIFDLGDEDEAIYNGCPLVIVIETGNDVEAICPIYGRVSTYTGSNTLTWDNDIVHIDATSGNAIITLPSPVGRDPGTDVFSIKRVDASGNTVTIDPAGAVTIDGVANKTLAQWDSREVYHDGTNWFIR